MRAPTRIWRSASGRFALIVKAASHRSAEAVKAPDTRARVRRMSDWLAASRLGLVVMAAIVGVGSGLGAAAFRELIYFVTWVFTGHETFGQQGHAPSLHLAFLGIFFVLVVPPIAGAIYGPLIQRFAREARGHGVPEVMLAVTENGGRIRPQVTVVKALASALCIGGGGSVGREGPIVQIGSAFASTLGQLVRMSEGRLRVIVACGAAGGISATFNAPLTGLFFGFEIVLKEFTLDALSATIVSAVTADVISRAFFGGAPFFAAIPHDMGVGNDFTYLLIAVLGIAAGLIGVAFQKTLYKGEDRADALVAGAAGVAAASRRRAAPRTSAPGAAADVWRRLSGDGPGAGKPLRAVVRGRPDGGQDPRRQPHPVDRRIRRGIRPVAVHRRGRRHGVRDHRQPPVRPGGRPARSLRGGGDGGRVRRRRASTPDRDRERRGDDRQLHPHAADHAGLRNRGTAGQADHLRKHLHHQAAAARDRHRTPQGTRRASGPDRRGGHATPEDARRTASAPRSRGLPPSGLPPRRRGGRSSSAP